jgi:hypothetical protein
MNGMSTGTQAGAEVIITVVRGNPTAEETAALVGVLLATGGVGTAGEAVPHRSAWWASGLPARPRSWRESGLPACTMRLRIT